MPEYGIGFSVQPEDGLFDFGQGRVECQDLVEAGIVTGVVEVAQEILERGAVYPGGHGAADGLLFSHRSFPACRSASSMSRAYGRLNAVMVGAGGGEGKTRSDCVPYI